MRLSVSALTDVGLRRQNNEDCVFADAEAGLFIVADGMGGHAAGEVASAMAVEIVRGQLPPQAPPPEDAAACLLAAFNQASASILQAARQDADRNGMGTTLSVLYLDAGSAQLAHVGDSRIYRLRNGELEQLSIDHSLVAEQQRQGLISAAEARTSPMRNVLLQAVGLEQKLDVYLARHPLRADDLFLLCSDGLSDMLDDDEIRTLLQRNDGVEMLAQRLIEAAKAAGGRDNIGVVVIRIER